jgi:cytochrome c-type biogenesis protein CcmH/NrfF
MDSLDRTYKALVSAKEEEITQLTHRLRCYEDENRKLIDINKTLQLTK